jgi:hypothetical protein
LHKSAALASDATEGRFTLGLGVSREPVSRALGIDMPNPIFSIAQLRDIGNQLARDFAHKRN